MAGNHYLITGATGAIAQEILPRLAVSDPDSEIVLLVRPKDGLDVSARLDAIHRHARTFHPGACLARVQAVQGDVTLPALGLSAADHGRLVRTTTHIVHCGASIKLNLTAECARAINVSGTERMLALASACARLERYAHVSTAYVAGTREGAILEDELYLGQDFVNTYEASKCEAESIVHAAARHLPITVFRPSIVAGSALDGHISAFATIYEPIRAVAIGLVRALPGNGDVHLDLVSVDVVGEAIVRLLAHPGSAGRTYHVTAGAGNTISARELLARSIALLGGPREPALTFGAAPGDPLAARLAPFTAYLAHAKIFDDAHLREDLGSWADRRPHPRDYLPRLLAYFAAARNAAPASGEERCATAA